MRDLLAPKLLGSGVSVPLWHGAPSKIHGNGAFASSPIKSGDVVDLVTRGFKGGGVLGIERTKLGELVNHQGKPNSSMHVVPPTADKYFLRADNDIGTGEEITMNYNDTPWFVAKPNQIDPEGYKSWR